MRRVQLRVLYRQFLFRIVDLEVLSRDAQGDASTLLGQFAAMLIFLSVLLSLPAIFGGSRSSVTGPAETVASVVLTQHFLIANTMLVVGIFAVLSWDATFPDRRDVLVLAPLPVRPGTIFLAKIAAVATSLGLTVLLLHSVLGLVWPLVFASRSSPATLPAATFETTPRPLAAAELPAAMDRALHQATTTGMLAPRTGVGLVIGVWKNGERRIMAYGGARQDSLFEIGSISKTFTGLMLARMVASGKVRLGEPVRELLPAGTVTKPMGTEITLLDLATHHSGLPGMPNNFRPSDPANPYADYGPRQLYTYLAGRGVAKPADSPYRYSNLGMGLLGQALAERSGTTYAGLLQSEIAAPLGLTGTVVHLTPELQRRFLQGHGEKNMPVHAWDLNGLAGAGAIRSSANDMLSYLEAWLHPERHAALSDAVVVARQVRASGSRAARVALAWMYQPESNTFQHGGLTGGFSSYASFTPQADCAVVVLMNSGANLPIQPVFVAEHVRQRLMGQPAFSLETVIVPGNEGFLAVLRCFASYWITMLAAGLFIYGGTLCVQGSAARVLPRQLFLRASGYLQLAAFCLIVGTYFLQPGLGGLNDLSGSTIWKLLQWLPSYWFLGLYQEFNGTAHPALRPLAQRAVMGLAVVSAGTLTVYALSYWRSIRQIVEEPDIVGHSRRRAWLPRFGNEAQTAIGQFSVRTLARSRQHRMILAFYLGAGLAFTSLLLRDPFTKRPFQDGAIINPWEEASVALWASSIIVTTLAIVGMRAVFGLPLDLRANWIFRVAGVPAGRKSHTAVRRALLFLSVTPAWLAWAALCFWLWPSWQTTIHLVVLALSGLILADVALLGMRKIPFTCSYLPGKSRFNLVVFGGVGLLLISVRGVLLERQALREVGTTLAMLALLALGWAVVIWLRRRSAGQQTSFEFDELATPAVQGLGLNRDGIVVVGSEPQ